jgi:P pilus assembly chaperone PapD
VQQQHQVVALGARAAPGAAARVAPGAAPAPVVALPGAARVEEGAVQQIRFFPPQYFVTPLVFLFALWFIVAALLF